MSNAISAQGTIVHRNGVLIAELRDITPPSLTRNPIERTNHNDVFDSWIVGIKRLGEMTLELGFLPSGEATHNNVAGLIKAWADGSNDLYRVGYPDGANMYFSGFVTNISPSQPVDDGQTASVTLRPSGGMIITP